MTTADAMISARTCGCRWREDKPPRVSRGERCWQRGQVCFWMTFEVLGSGETLEIYRQTEEGKPDQWSAWILWRSRQQSNSEPGEAAAVRAWIAGLAPVMQQKYAAMIDEAFAELASRDPASVEYRDPSKPRPVRALFKGEDGKVHLFVKDSPDSPMREDPEGLKRVPRETIEDILMTNDRAIEEPVAAVRDIDGPFRL